MIDGVKYERLVGEIAKKIRNKDIKQIDIYIEV